MGKLVEKGPTGAGKVAVFQAIANGIMSYWLFQKKFQKW